MNTHQFTDKEVEAIRDRRKTQFREVVEFRDQLHFHSGDSDCLTIWGEDADDLEYAAYPYKVGDVFPIEGLDEDGVVTEVRAERLQEAIQDARLILIVHGRSLRIKKR